ncbi:MAG TPA: hypothetical protein VNT58_08490 [Gaiellaceae bacterium]|nr:hypothetical protein [Gaiellaceae bacterium]
MRCRCTEAAEFYGPEAEAYAAEHLVLAEDQLACPDTGARWQSREGADGLVLTQIDGARISRSQPTGG